MKAGLGSTRHLPITRRMLGVGLDGSRPIWPAHVGGLVGPDGFRRMQTDRLDDHRDDQRASDKILGATPLLVHGSAFVVTKPL
jgi:hypothetical protein